MNWEEKVERLAARARSEQLPQVDVAHGVLAMLASGQAAPITVTERLWMWLAAGSAAVAVPAAVIAVVLYNTAASPLREIVDSISWAM